jgi:TniQ
MVQRYRRKAPHATAAQGRRSVVRSRASVTLYGITSMPEETFGSWFKRVAASHYVTRDELGDGLLAKTNRELPACAIDWDLDPPAELLDAVSSCLTRESRAGLEDMIPAMRPDHLRNRDRNAWCPKCWKNHIASGSVYVRKQWLRAWNTLCDLHRCPLVPVPRDFETKLALIYAGRGCRFVDYQEVIEPWMPPYSEDCLGWFATVQRLFASERSRSHTANAYLGTAEKPIRSERGILRDIVRLLGSRSKQPGSNSPMNLIGAYGRRRWLFFDNTDDGDNEAHGGPSGGIERRLELIRVAGCFWRWMHDEYREVPGSAERTLMGLIARGEFRDEILRASRDWPYEYQSMTAQIGLSCGERSLAGHVASFR